MVVNGGKKERIRIAVRNVTDYVPALRPLANKMVKPLYLDSFPKYEKRIEQMYGDNKKLMEDVKYWSAWHGFTPVEYNCFEFERMPVRERKQWISYEYKDRMCLKLGNFSEKYINLFMKKYETYKFYRPYYRREVICVSEEKDGQVFDSFFRKHPHFIIKPAAGSHGHGIRTVNEAYTEHRSRELFCSILSEGEAICEEFLVEADALQKLNPGTLNTIRVTTFHIKSEITVFLPIIRIGRKGMVVDNASSGGIFCAIDPQTGVLISDGFTYQHETFASHPDTGISFRGFQIPRWDELLALLPELLAKIPEIQYIGWDFALTDEGWTIVEANIGSNLGSGQIAHGGKSWRN